MYIYKRIQKNNLIPRLRSCQNFIKNFKFLSQIHITFSKFFNLLSCLFLLVYFDNSPRLVHVYCRRMSVTFLIFMSLILVAKSWEPIFDLCPKERQILLKHTLVSNLLSTFSDKSLMQDNSLMIFIVCMIDFFQDFVSPFCLLEFKLSLQVIF